MNINNKFELNQEVMAVSTSDYESHIGNVLEIKIDRVGNISYLIYFHEGIKTSWTAEELVSSIKT